MCSDAYERTSRCVASQNLCHGISSLDHSTPTLHPRGRMLVPMVPATLSNLLPGRAINCDDGLNQRSRRRSLGGHMSIHLTCTQLTRNQRGRHTAASVCRWRLEHKIVRVVHVGCGHLPGVRCGIINSLNVTCERYQISLLYLYTPTALLLHRTTTFYRVHCTPRIPMCGC